MPISVSCPSCSAGFKVKDEYAGKRAKCPKCGEPLTIPAPLADFELIDDEPPPKPVVAAKPVVASKPKLAPVPADDDGGEPVSPKRKRGASSDDEDVSPKGKRRASDDDEKPKGKRRRDDDDDDEPKKKGKALPIILGVVGGVLLLCGGGCAGGWFGFLKPGLDYRREQAEKDRREDTHGKLTPENVSRVQPGMTLTQVEDVLGKGYPAEMPAVADVFFRHPQRDRVRPAWDSRASAGRVYRWTHPFDKVLVAFTTDPKAGGTVEGVTYLMGNGLDPVDTITLPGTSGEKPAAETAVVMPARDFFRLPQAQRRSYSGKLVQLSGPVQRVQRQSFPDNRPVTYGTIEVGPARGKTVPCLFTGDNWTKLPEFDDLKEYVVVGMGKEENFELTLTNCRVVGEATPPPNDGSLTFANAAQIKAGMTLAQIETMFGKGAAPTIDQVVTWLAELSNVTEARERWTAKHKSGHTLIWKKTGQVWDQIVVAFSDDPNSGGVVVGVYGYIGLKVVEVVKLPAATGGGTVTLPGGETAIEVTADELLAEYVKDSDAAEKKYLGKLVRVTGEVKVPSTNSIAFAQKMDAGFTFSLIALFAPEQQKQLTGMMGGEKVVLVGRVTKLFVNMKSKFKGVSLQESKLVN